MNADKHLQYYEKLKQREYNNQHTPDKQQIFLSINDKIVGVNQSFVVYSGLPKGGKTTYIAATIASYISNTNIFGIGLKLPAEKQHLVLFDTESSEYDFYKNIDKIKHFANTNVLDSNMFTAFALREDNSIDIKHMIIAYLESNKNTGCVVIDGLLDLCIDYNDVKDSRNTIQFLKYITKKYNCFVLCVLHLGKKDLQTLGHLGSMVDRYANSVIKIEKNKESQTFDMSSSFMRSDVDFEPISIRYFENSGYQLAEKESENKQHTYKEWTLLEHKARVNKIMLEKGIQYKDLILSLKELENIGDNAAKKIVSKWITESLIYKKDNLYFY